MELKGIWEFYHPWSNEYFPTALPASPTSPAQSLNT